jgi:hypothetical protein
MRRFLLLAAAVGSLIFAACADPAAPGAGGSPEPDATHLEVYETMVRHLAGQEQIQWSEVVIVRGICANAGEPAEHTGCDEEFSASDEEAMLGRLADLAPTVRFVDDPTPMFDEDWMQGEPDRIVLWLGPIEDKGDEIQVGGSFGCGGLCGSGSTWVLREKADGWKVTGSTGSMWIA